MKNKLTDLKNHLFAEIERLGDESLSPEKLDEEVKRATAMVGIADQIVKTCAIQIRAAEIASDYSLNPEKYLKDFEGDKINGQTINGHMIGNA